MRYEITYIADLLGVDQDALMEFAIQNFSSYGISLNQSNLEVSTWYVDQLIADFKATEQKRQRQDAPCR